MLRHVDFKNTIRNESVPVSGVSWGKPWYWYDHNPISICATPGSLTLYSPAVAGLVIFWGWAVLSGASLSQQPMSQQPMSQSRERLRQVVFIDGFDEENFLSDLDKASLWTQQSSISHQHRYVLGGGGHAMLHPFISENNIGCLPSSRIKELRQKWICTIHIQLLQLGLHLGFQQ